MSNEKTNDVITEALSLDELAPHSTRPLPLEGDERPTAPPVETQAIEHWQRAHGVPAWKHDGATRMHRWGFGRELSESEYMTGVEAFASRPVEA